MKGILKYVKKLKIKEGGILFFPQELVCMDKLRQLARAIDRRFPKAKIILMPVPTEALEHIKLINIKPKKKKNQ